MATKAQYDAGEKALEQVITEAEQKLPFMAKRLISQAPPEQVKAFLSMASKAVIDAAIKAAPVASEQHPSDKTHG